MTSRGLLRALVPVMAVMTAATVWADDLNPPPWRGDEGTSFQEWTFPDPNLPHLPDPGWVNPFGGDGPHQMDTYNSGIEWLPEYEGRGGVFCLGANGGQLMFSIPNADEPDHTKYIWAQLTWRVASGDQSVALEPDGGDRGTGTTIGQMPLENGWNHSTFEFVLDGCPKTEFFRIINRSDSNIYLDQVVIDTKCVPEPSSMAVLGLGAAALVRKRRARTRSGKPG